VAERRNRVWKRSNEGEAEKRRKEVTRRSKPRHSEADLCFPNEGFLKNRTPSSGSEFHAWILPSTVVTEARPQRISRVIRGRRQSHDGQARISGDSIKINVKKEETSPSLYRAINNLHYLSYL
jgi:hypothetical protein